MKVIRSSLLANMLLSMVAWSQALAELSSTVTSAPSKIKLSYFDIEGAGEPVRLALELAGVEYEDHRIVFEDWKDIKPQTPFGQVPIMSIDDGPPRGQSGAMLRWVAMRFSETLYPRDKVFDIEEAIGVVQDFQSSFQPGLYLSFNPQAYGLPQGFGQTEEGKAMIKDFREKWIQEKLPIYCGYMESLLDRHNGMFLASSDHPTVADCLAVPALRRFSMGTIDHVSPDVLNSYPKIKAYVQRFCNLEPVQGRYSKGLF